MALIERETLKICKHGNAYGYCFLHEEYCPEGPCREEELVEYAPVVHGQWIECDDDIYTWIECSECGFEQDIDDCGEHPHEAEDYKLCPSCGARMDGGEEHEGN